MMTMFRGLMVAMVILLAACGDERAQSKADSVGRELSQIIAEYDGKFWDLETEVSALSNRVSVSEATVKDLLAFKASQEVLNKSLMLRIEELELKNEVSAVVEADLAAKLQEAETFIAATALHSCENRLSLTDIDSPTVASCRTELERGKVYEREPGESLEDLRELVASANTDGFADKADLDTLAGRVSEVENQVDNLPPSSLQLDELEERVSAVESVTDAVTIRPTSGSGKAAIVWYEESCGGFNCREGSYAPRKTFTVDVHEKDGVVVDGYLTLYNGRIEAAEDVGDIYYPFNNAFQVVAHLIVDGEEIDQDTHSYLVDTSVGVYYLEFGSVALTKGQHSVEVRFSVEEDPKNPFSGFDIVQIETGWNRVEPGRGDLLVFTSADGTVIPDHRIDAVEDDIEIAMLYDPAN